MCVCGSNRTMSVSGKTSDTCSVRVGHLDISHEGYVPGGMGIGRGDYLEFNVCLDCGVLQGFKPLSDDAVRRALED